MKILLVGGGSGGPVTPLLAVADEIKNNHPQAHFLLVGTHGGPEILLAKKAGIEFVAIVSGKWRRYLSLRNIYTPFQVAWGFFQALFILRKFKPDCVFGTGAFVQVPVIWAAWLLRIRVVIHQQDIVVGLANRLCQFFASKITVTFEESLKSFPSSVGLFYSKGIEKVLLTGNAVRKEMAEVSRKEGLKAFGLHSNLPVLLVMGGGTGAQALNKLTREMLPDLHRVIQIIHVTGSQKQGANKTENYQSFEFLTNMGHAMAAADIVVCRAGLATITELAYLSKIAIVIPMPNTHQEFNAFLLATKRAALVLDQSEASPELLTRMIRKLLFNVEMQQALKRNISSIMPKNGTEKIANVIVKVASTAY